MSLITNVATNQQYPRSETVLTIQGLTKQFDARPVVTNVRFDVYPGEIVALVGPNGAGKSTILRCVVGELAPDAGSVTICGYHQEQDSIKAKAALGYAADEPFLYPYLTGMEHLQLWHTLRRLHSNTFERGCAIATSIGLAEVLGTQVRTYSRGMRQKLAFIGAIFHQPRLVVLDEPFTATDQHSTDVAISLLTEAMHAGAGVLFVSHQTAIINRLANRVLRIQNGHLEEIERNTKEGSLCDTI